MEIRWLGTLLRHIKFCQSNSQDRISMRLGVSWATPNSLISSRCPFVSREATIACGIYPSTTTFLASQFGSAYIEHASATAISLLFSCFVNLNVVLIRFKFFVLLSLFFVLLSLVDPGSPYDEECTAGLESPASLDPLPSTPKISQSKMRREATLAGRTGSHPAIAENPSVPQPKLDLDMISLSPSRPWPYS